MDYQNDYRSQSDLVLPKVADGSIAKNFMANVFGLMFLGLGISAVLAVFFSNNINFLIQYLYNVDSSGRVSMNALGWIVMFAPLGFVFAMSLGFNRLSGTAMLVLFLLYSAVNGISFSFILLAYSTKSVIGCFAAAASMFGIMAVMGYTTKQDLTKFGRILFMGVIGIIIAMVINMFLKSGTMDYIISIIGVMVFTGLTAYDVQKLKRIGAGIESDGIAATQTRKLAVFGALSLYIDFINIFLFLLRLFGGRRD